MIAVNVSLIKNGLRVIPNPQRIFSFDWPSLYFYTEVYNLKSLSTQGGRYSSIFEAINAIAAHLAPPIATVFLWGVFWRRGTKEAALTTLVFGFSLGAVAFAVELPLVGDSKLITDGWGIPFMMQAWWSFCICSIVYVIISLLTPEPDASSIEGLTWEHQMQVIKHGKLTGISDPRALAGLLFLLMVILYIILK